LFAAITDHYSYRDRLGVDWAQLERDHHDALVGSLDGPALALRIAEVLATAQDPHITVRWRETVLSTYQRAVVANFDARGLAPHFPKLQRVGRIGLHGRSDDGIGYLMVSTFARDQREDFDLVVDTLRHLRDCKALVLDVRQNGGGDELLARRLAAFFVRGDKVYAAHRVRDPKAPEGFRDREDREIRGNQDPETFAGPVAVLMGPANMSSCEAFLLMMKQAPQVVLVGADSFGSSGNPQPHTLVAGLSVLLPSWQAMRPDGSVIEGEGIAPHIHVAADADQLATADPVVGEALLRLRGQR
jgi:C-terminal processing protease CtpA/Prc